MSKKKKVENKLSRQAAVKRRSTFLDRHPNFLPLVLLALLLIVFFNEVMFFGKTYLPPDAIASQSVRPFVYQAFANGQYPLWNPYIFSGMPSFASLQAAPYIDPLGDVIKLLYLPFSWLPVGDFVQPAR